MRHRPLADVLGQSTRYALLDVARRAPGVSLSRAAAALALNASTVHYHARVLERHGALMVVPFAGAVRLYPPGAAPARDVRDLAQALACPTARDVANAVWVSGGATLHDLVCVLDLPRSTAGDHLRRLAAAGVLRVEARAGAKRYRPAWPGGAS